MSEETSRHYYHMPQTPLDYFLDGSGDGKDDGRKVTENGKPFTLWSFENKNKWFLPEDDLPEFYQLYAEDLENTVPRYFTEKSTAVGQLRVDLDFKYAGDVRTHKHTRDQVMTFVREYMAEVQKYVEMPESVDVFILEKDRPTFSKKDNVSKSGIHIQVPVIKTRAGVEQALRRALVKRMEEFFPNLGLMNDWEDAYDKQPLTHTNNWPLLGSKKPDGMPYKVKYVLDWKKDELTVNPVTPKLSVDLIRKLSVRSPPSDETSLTEFGKANVHHSAERELMSGRDRILAGQQQRGRPATRIEGETPNSRGSSPGRILVPPLSQELRHYYEGHVHNLNANRYLDYATWISVGQCLKNIHPELNDLWHDFSSKYEKYTFSETENKWNSFHFRIDGSRLSVGSLRHWSAIDNHEGYKQVENSNIDRLVEKSADTGTENDVAQMVYAKYRDEFRCAKYGASLWYRYTGHTWKETDKGIALQVRLSKEVADIYFDKEQYEMNNIRAVGQCDHKETKIDCECCQHEKRKKKYLELRLKLKRTGFKKSVMDECRELFLDETLVLKLDEDKHLIAFNNGVFDTMGSDDKERPWFRDGKPEDYISFSTGLDYNPEMRHEQYACWPEMEAFLKSILPNRNVREYFLRHLSTCLTGGNDAQKFHILTGSGSNGKSMLTNLTTTAFGDYSCKAPISLLTQQRNKSAAAAPELVRMKGRRFVTMQEPDEQVPLNTGLMKELASCEKITARDLYAGSKQMIDFDIQARFHLACNEKPKVNTTDGGTWRRLVVVDFPMKFVHEPRAANELPIDETLVKKVVSEEWATCFLTYLVELYKQGNGWRKITPPDEVMVYTNEYKEESDVLARFIREHFHEVVAGEEPTPIHWNTITTTFQEWKRSNEVTGRGNATDLKKKLDLQFGKMPRGGWTSFRFGNV